MVIFSISAVRKIPVKVLNQWLIISSRFIYTDIPSSQKMTWEDEKQKLLSSYNVRYDTKWTLLKDIKTWEEYAQENNLSQAASALTGYDIDNSKNALLAKKISIFTGDITTLKVDAIVNAANKYLKVGAGVDGAIHGAAGRYLQQECQTLGGCPTGEAKITGGYQLPAKYVIHAVGPRGENSTALKNCYVNSLKLAIENNVKSIAFPCISTGVYGYPNEAAAHVASYNVRKFLEEHSDKLDRVIFCLFLAVDKDLYVKILQTYFPLK